MKNKKELKFKYLDTKCDVCSKVIRDDEFKVIQIFTATHEDREQDAFCNCEKELNVCNDCILNLNFRGVSNADLWVSLKDRV